MDLVERIDMNKSTERLEFFSDAVFAIVMTLLVLDIKVPHLEEAAGQTTLFSALLNQWHSYLSYAISFIFIGLFWAAHHNMFRYIKRSSHILLVLNTLFLMFIALIPFSTALLAEYIGRSEARTAALVYIGTYILADCFFNLMWWSARSKFRLIDKNINPQLLKVLSREHTIALVSYLAAFVIAFFSPVAGLIPFIFLTVLFVLPRPDERIAANEPSA